MVQDNLRYVIQPGDTIYTQCHTYDEWIPNVVESIDNNLIKINLTEYYFRKGVMVGDFISIKFSYSDNEYVLEGEVSDIDIYNTYTISIFINNVSVYKNRRRNFRFYAKLGANLKTDPSDKGIYSIITNISLSGVAIISKANVNVNSEIFIDIFESSQNIISVEGSIVRKKALNYGFEYGIAIKDTNEITMKKIKTLISKLENQYFNIY